MSFDVEFIQIDPPGSPTAGHGHYGGSKSFPTLEDARAFVHPAGRFIGSPVPPEYWAPCCDWQSPETPVSRVVIISVPDGEHFEEFRREGEPRLGSDREA